MLKVKDIHFGYGITPVISGVSFNVTKGKLCGLFGPNGCGKTTLFKCCLRFLNPGCGAVHMDGSDIRHLSIGELAKTVAYVPQEHKPPFPYLVKEVVMMGRTPHLGGIFGINKKDREKVSEALEMVGISGLAEMPYNHLSGGQRQMVLIARAIAQETPLMFLDEPTSALDFSNQIRVWKIMQRIARSGKTIVACSHDPNHVLWFCDRVVVMNSEGVVAEGEPDEVINESTLGTIYSNNCCVKSMDGVSMVMPFDVAEKSSVLSEEIG